MNMLISQKHLNEALSLVLPFVPSRPSYPVLSHVLIKGENDKITITACDCATQLQLEMVVRNLQIPEGGVLIPAKLLADLVKTLPNENLSFSFSQTNSSVVIEVSNGTFTLPYTSSEDFPELPIVESSTTITVPCDNFVTALKQVLYACSNDETKQVLKGIRISQDPSNNLAFAATNGHLLAICDTNLSLDTALEITLPSSAVRTLKDLVQDCETLNLSFSEDYLSISSEGINLICRPLMGAYPAYRLLIPSQFLGSTAFNQAEILAALKRASVILGDSKSMVLLAISDSSLEVQTTADNKGSFESIDCKTTGEIAGKTYCFQLSYLIDAIKNAPSHDIVLNANRENQPVIFSSSETSNGKYLALVMPIHVRGE